MSMARQKAAAGNTVQARHSSKVQAECTRCPTVRRLLSAVKVGSSFLCVSCLAWLPMKQQAVRQQAVGLTAIGVEGDHVCAVVL